MRLGVAYYYLVSLLEYLENKRTRLAAPNRVTYRTKLIPPPVGGQEHDRRASPEFMVFVLAMECDLIDGA